MYKIFINFSLVTLGIILFCVASVYGQSEDDIRKNYLKEIIQLQERPGSFDSFVSYHDETWLDWVDRTGALPPNFGETPSIPLMPNPLIIDEGGKNIQVETTSQWIEKRKWIKSQVQHILSGTFPDPPESITAHILEKRVENEVTISMIELRFGEDARAKLTVEMFTPPGEGPFPVFMTQWNHRGWAQIAVRRGYIGLVYAGADAKDDTRDYLSLYPDHDWSTLMTRAWGAHRAVDYLYELDVVDKSRIAITGHSRNGKQSLFAAAFDERITAVISSSGGTGGELPYRFTDDRHSNESLDYLTSRRTHWLHPRLRFYIGREHKMPIDQNSLMALIAPNSLLLSTSIREGGGGDAWAIEQMYTSMLKVYEYLDVPEKIGVRMRDGEHGVVSRDIEDYMDWLDIQFNRLTIPWDNKLFYNYSFEEWKSLSNQEIDPDTFPEVPEGESVLISNRGDKINTIEEWTLQKKDIKHHVNWLLGDTPAGVSADPISILSTRTDYVNSFMSRPRVTNGEIRNIAPYNAFGDYLSGSLYYPTNDSGEMMTRENDKIPVVIYLHRYSNTGYDTHTDIGLSSLFEKILSNGLAVFAMDMIGFGERIEDGTNFYLRYPQWTKLGKMVSDTRAAIDALESLDFIDKDKIYVSGYALGGTVGLFTAALDERIAGTAVSSSFTPLRDDHRNTEGLQAYSHLHGLIPRLGFFIGNEQKVPVDYPEIISLLAPRPLLVMSPELDRHAKFEQVTKCMIEVKSVYELMDANSNLSFITPYEFNGFSSLQQKELVNWLKEISGL